MLFRTAVTLRRWLAGREITACSDRRLVGRRVESVEAFGKHLLIRLHDGSTLHTHLRMTGSWHVYSKGEKWRRPEHQARLVMACGERLAVCFNAPVVELLAPGGEGAHPSLSRLGPDVLADPLDAEDIRQRARARDPDSAVGELLLDQAVAAGIGNIWRCEALFLESLNPWTPMAALDDDRLDGLFATVARLMHASAGIGGRPDPRWVYRRSGRPCRRCATSVSSRSQGEQARVAYWCPTCQPAERL